MTVSERKAGYTGKRKARVAADEVEAEYAGASTDHKLVPPTEPIALVNWLHEVAGQVENNKHHNNLKKAMTEHMYARSWDSVADESSGDDFE